MPRTRRSHCPASRKRCERSGFRVQVALTTGFSRDAAEPLLDQLSWHVGPEELLDAVVTADEVAAGRPAPAKIHRAMERTATLSASTVCVAGDTAVDVQAGTNAGAAMVVGVLTGKLQLKDFQDYPHTHVIKGVAGLPDLLRTLS